MHANPWLFYHSLCPDDRSDPADGNLAPPPLLAALPPARSDAGAGFEYELEEEEEEEDELLLKLVPTPLAGLAALAETPAAPAPCGFSA